jgi:CelD/BcsL family acetyltransferase involved in cellulose biosynthesis
MQVQEIRSYHDLLALEGAWKDLFDRRRSPNVFLTWEWAVTWWKHLGSSNQLLVLVAKEGDQVRGIAPLYASRVGWGFRRRATLRFVGAGLADYLDFLTAEDPGPAIAAFLEYLAKGRGRWAKIVLGEIRGDSPSVALVADGIARLRLPALRRIPCTSPYVTLNGSWETYLRSLGKHHRKNLSWLLRRLERVQDASIRHECSAAVLQQIFEVHRRRQAGRAHLSLFESPRMVGFFAELADLFQRQGWLDVCTLWIQKELAAYVFGFQYGGAYSYWNVSFDPHYSEYAPGHMMIHHLLKRCFDQGLTEFDFMKGAEDYKLKWASHQRPSYEFVIFPSPAHRAVERARLQTRSALVALKNRSKLVRKAWIKTSKLARPSGALEER